MVGFYTYVLLKEETSLDTLVGQNERIHGSFYEPHGETRSETLSLRKLRLQPITDIHLRSKFKKEMNPNSDITYVYIFSFVAFFILLLAALILSIFLLPNHLAVSRKSGCAKLRAPEEPNSSNNF